jgi:methionyl-tRNA formyltransferase
MYATLDDFTFVYYENFRSRAYAQALSENRLFPKKIIKLGDEIAHEMFSKYPSVSLSYSTTEFNPQISVASSFEKFGREIESISIDNVNSNEFIELLKKINCKYLIYSGKAGTIIKTEVLHACEGVLHVHGGYLPEYRGSTTFYYSILDKFEIGASAIFLNAEIDEGSVIHKQKYSPSKGVDVDYIQDPMVRAEVLLGALNILMENDPDTIVEPQDKMKGNTYRVIHPVLKSLALRKLECESTQYS